MWKTFLSFSLLVYKMEGQMALSYQKTSDDTYKYPASSTGKSTTVKTNGYTNDPLLAPACGCDATGSSNLQCANSTGLCTCNAGYKGTKCNATCGCHTTGSSNTSCDQSTGQCTCNTGYTGITCNTCDANYYKASDGATCACQYPFEICSRQL